MLNKNYTTSTSYKFYNACCDTSEQINAYGVYPQDKIEKVLLCNSGNKVANSEQWVQFFIPEIVDIPVQKPDIESVVGIHSCIEIISKKVIKTPIVKGYTDSTGVYHPGNTIPNGECTTLTGRKLIVEGFLKQKVIYTAEVAEQTVHSASFSMPFSTFIIIDKDTPLSQNFRVYPYIEDIYACKLSNRSLFKNTTIFIKASQIY